MKLFTIRKVSKTVYLIEHESETYHPYDRFYLFNTQQDAQEYCDNLNRKEAADIFDKKLKDMIEDV